MTTDARPLKAYRAEFGGAAGIYMGSSRGKAVMAVVLAIRESGMAKRGRWPRGLRVARAPDFDILAESLALADDRGWDLRYATARRDELLNIAGGGQ